MIVHRPDINLSCARADLDRDPDGQLVVRLGLDEVRSITTDLAEQITAGRPAAGYASIDHLTQTVDLTTPQVEALATAGALDTLIDEHHAPRRAAGQGHRRRALWAAGPASRVDAGMLPGTRAAAPPELPGTSLTGRDSDRW